MRLGVATCRSQPEPQPEDARMLAALPAGCELLVAPWDDLGADWRSCDAVLVRSVWDYHLRVEEFLAWVSRLDATGTTVWNPPDLIAWNARKTYLLEIGAAGVPTVPTVLLEARELDRWPDLIVGTGWAEVVLKPIVGASAFLTWRSSGRAAAERVDRLARLAAHGGALVQPFLSEVESAGEWSLVFFEGALSHAVLKRARAGEFRVQVEYGGSEEPATPPPSVLETAGQALAALPGQPLYARIDGLATAGGFLVSEVELIEPVLFLEAADGAAATFATAIAERFERWVAS